MTPVSAATGHAHTTFPHDSCGNVQLLKAAGKQLLHTSRSVEALPLSRSTTYTCQTAEAASLRRHGNFTSSAEPGLSLAKAAAALWGCDIEVVAHLRSVADHSGPAAHWRYLSWRTGPCVAAKVKCQTSEVHSPHLAPAVHTRNAASRRQADSLSAHPLPRFALRSEAPKRLPCTSSLECCYRHPVACRAALGTSPARRGDLSGSVPPKLWLRFV